MSRANPTQPSEVEVPNYQGSGGVYGKQGDQGDRGAALGSGGNRDPVYQPVAIPEGQIHEYGRGHALHTYTQGRDDGMAYRMQGEQAPADRPSAPFGDREFGNQSGVGGTGQPQARMGDQGPGGQNVASYDQSEFGQQLGAAGTAMHQRDPATQPQDQAMSGATQYQDALFGAQRGTGGEAAHGEHHRDEHAPVGVHRRDEHAPVGATGMTSTQHGQDSTTTGMTSAQHGQPSTTAEHSGVLNRDPDEKEGKRLERSGKVDKIIGTLLGSSSLKERGAEKQAEGAAQKEEAKGDTDTSIRNTHAATGTRTGEHVPISNTTEDA